MWRKRWQIAEDCCSMSGMQTKGNKKVERVSVPLSPEEREKLRELAERWERSEGNAARLLLRDSIYRAHQTGEDIGGSGT